ncbi:MAG: FCD domain-containing protein [Deltaproteobacteria bacterium]|nr:FCD domain-containing protein [Deltaproteobacteria bacterium]
MLKIQPRPVAKVTVVDGVIDELKHLLSSSQMGAGTRLPSERQLAQDMQVSRPMLREALRTLSLMGLLNTRHGSGSVVADSGADLFKVPMELMLALEKPAVSDLHETRELLEVFLVGRAAANRSAQHVRDMKACLVQMAERLDDEASFTAADLRFHAIIADAADNVILKHIMNTLRDSVGEMVERSWSAEPDPKVSYADHKRVFEAIVARDAKAARRAMARHMLNNFDELAAAKLVPSRR